MAQRITGGLIFPAASMIAAHNENHRAVAALEIAASAKPHYDGAEYSETDGSVLLLPGSSPTTLSGAVDTFNALKSLLNSHYGCHNSGSGKKIFAHKITTTAISVADLSAGSVYDAALLQDVVALIVVLQAWYLRHIASTTYHVAADTTYILGATPTILSWAQAAEALNNLKAQVNDHIAFSAGGSPHVNAGTTPVTAANCTSSDLDSIVALVKNIKVKLLAHGTEAMVHSANDATAIATADPALSTELTDNAALPNTLRSSYETHRASTSIHDSADSTNTITASAHTTVADLIALAAEMYTDVQAHVLFAPLTRAMRGV